MYRLSTVDRKAGASGSGMNNEWAYGPSGSGAFQGLDMHERITKQLDEDYQVLQAIRTQLAVSPLLNIDQRLHKVLLQELEAYVKMYFNPIHKMPREGQSVNNYQWFQNGRRELLKLYEYTNTYCRAVVTPAHPQVVTQSRESRGTQFVAAAAVARPNDGYHQRRAQAAQAVPQPRKQTLVAAAAQEDMAPEVVEQAVGQQSEEQPVDLEAGSSEQVTDS